MHPHSKTPVSIWWKEPMVWLVAGLPATAVIAAISTYFIAAHNQDPLVTTEYRKEGMTVERVTERDDKAASAGIGADLAVKDGQLRLSLSGRLEQLPGALTLTIVHPTQADKDRQISLVHTNQGRYIAPDPDTGTGKRQLVLEPPDRAWRITGQWQAPFSGSTTLAATTTNPSTHP